MSKRLRSLASILWDSDSEQPETFFGVAGPQHTQIRELQSENDFLKVRAQQLSSEVEALKREISRLSSSPSELVSSHSGIYTESEQWIHSLRDEVVHLPRLHLEVLPELMDSKYCSGCIIFDLPKVKATASQVTRHGENCISKLSKQHPVVFKVGITSNPLRRWMHPLYGYARDRLEKWQGMKVFSVTADSFSAALLESFLISKFKGTPGCRNENPGGESACPGKGPHFSYVVFRVLVPPMVRAKALPDPRS